MLKFFNIALIMVLAFWLSLAASWQTLSATNFLYPVFYSWLDIDRTITIFGPQNRYKKAFENTTRDERFSLFAKISQAINNEGRGLENIVYHDKNGKPIDLLLRDPEIIHLQDVAKLIDVLRNAAYFSVVAFGLLLVWARKKNILFPSLAKAYFVISIVISAIIIGVVLIGPTQIFYKFHTLIFPDNHQWFFFYQESLMTTLMKAPDLFGYIAAILILIAIFYYSLILLFTQKILSSKN